MTLWYCAVSHAAAAAAVLRGQPSSSASSQPRPQPTSAHSRPSNSAMSREAARKQYEDPSNSLKGTADRRKQQQQQQQQQAAGKGSSNANPLVTPHLPEVCPQCNARFATVAALCAHADEWHSTSTAAGARSSPAVGSWTNPLAHGGGSGSDDVYRCHNCQAVFSDPVALVSHTELGQCVASRDVIQREGGSNPPRNCTIC